MTAKSRSDLFGLLGLLLLGQIASAQLFSLAYSPLSGGDDYLAIARRFPSLLTSEWTYVGYVTVLRFGSLLGSAPWFAVVVQCLAAMCGGAALLSLGRRFSGDLAGWVAATIYLLHPLVAQWTRYLLTESLFYSGVILVAWCLVRAIDLRRLAWFPLWLTTTIVTLMRPNGILLIGATITVGALAVQGRVAFRRSLVVLAWGTIILIATVASPYAGSADSNRIGPRTWTGDVVWNVPEERITMPQPADRDPSNSAFIRYVLDHPIDMVNLGARRVWWELKQVRPWYSRELNAFTAASMSGFYLLAAVGAWASRRTTLTLVVSGITLPFIALIALTWAIWEGRFGWWFLVLWTVWAGVGAQWLVDQISLHVAQFRSKLRCVPPKTSQGKNISNPPEG